MGHGNEVRLGGKGQEGVWAEEEGRRRCGTVIVKYLLPKHGLFKERKATEPLAVFRQIKTQGSSEPAAVRAWAQL